MAKALPSALVGQWFEFEDANGHGYCQADFILELPEGLLVVETKLRWVAEGHAQVDGLYRPVASAVFGLPAFGGVLCKVLVPEMDGVLVQTLGGMLRASRSGHRAVLHWWGVGVLPVL